MADDTIALASLSLTHVYYDPDDHVSLACAYLALLPQALCVVYASLIFSTREAEVTLMFAGQMACEALNFALKRLIKEERPPQMNGKGYGMPSSHAQFVAFWSVSVVLFLLVRHRPPPPPPPPAATSTGFVEFWHRPWSLPERVAASAGALGIAGATAWSRIYLKYHTEVQVFAGVSAGVVIAVGWFVVTAIVRETGWLRWGLDIPIARAFRFRDLVIEEDMCQAGWEKWEEKRKATGARAKKVKRK